MDDPFRWKLLFKALILPPAAPLLIALIGLALLDRHRRAGRFLTTFGVVLLVLVKSTKESALSQPSGITYAVPSRHLQSLLDKAR